MTTWTIEQLDQIGGAHEVRIAGRRPDGSLRKPVIVWLVRRGDDIYTRSVNGPEAGWFRDTRPRHEGRISAGALNANVDFVDVGNDPRDDALQADIDEAYRVKYGRNSSPVAAITSPLAQSTTLRLLPQTS